MSEFHDLENGEALGVSTLVTSGLRPTSSISSLQSSIVGSGGGGLHVNGVATGTLSGSVSVSTTLSSISTVSSGSAPSSTDALVKVIGYVTLAGLVGILIRYSFDAEHAVAYATAYLVEESLSVDNLFVFLIIFRYFQVPRESQEPVLFWGILGAMILRGVMIVLGEELVKRFRWLYLIFAGILIVSAYKLLVEDDDDAEDLSGNSIVRFSRRWIPVSDRFHGTKFFVREGNRMVATPLCLVLVCIELSDVVFAMDSVPAVLGISDDELVVYTSNIMAILGLRSLYFVVADAIGHLRYLKPTVALILGFIAVKMIVGLFGVNIDTWISLAIVVGILSAGLLMSVIYAKDPKRIGEGVPENIR